MKLALRQCHEKEGEGGRRIRKMGVTRAGRGVEGCGCGFGCGVQREREKGTIL